MSVPDQNDGLPDVQAEEPSCLPPIPIIVGSKRPSSSPRDNKEEELQLVPQKRRRLDPEKTLKWCEWCRKTVECFILHDHGHQKCQRCMSMSIENMSCSVCGSKHPDLILYVTCPKCHRISHLNCIEGKEEHGIAQCNCGFDLPIESPENFICNKRACRTGPTRSTKRTKGGKNGMNTNSPTSNKRFFAGCQPHQTSVTTPQSH